MTGCLTLPDHSNKKNVIVPGTLHDGTVHVLADSLYEVTVSHYV